MAGQGRGDRGAAASKGGSSHLISTSHGVRSLTLAVASQNVQVVRYRLIHLAFFESDAGNELPINAQDGVGTW